MPLYAILTIKMDGENGFKIKNIYNNAFNHNLYVKKLHIKNKLLPYIKKTLYL